MNEIGEKNHANKSINWLPIDGYSLRISIFRQEKKKQMKIKWEEIDDLVWNPNVKMTQKAH